MKTFRRLLSFSRPYHHYIPEYIVYILLYIVFGLLNFSLLVPLLDVLFNNTPYQVVKALPPFSFSADYFKEAFYYYLNYYITSHGKFGVLLYVCIILFLCVLLKNLFGFLSQKVLTRMRVNLVRRLRERLFHQFSHQSLSFFHNEKKGDLLATISGDVVEIENSVVSSIQTIFREPLVIIATFCMLFYYSRELTFFTLVFFPVSGYIISSISRRLKKKANYSQSLGGNILNMSEEAIGGVRIIQGFNAEETVNRRFSQENQKLARTIKSIVNQRELASPISEVLGVLVIIIIIVYGGSLIINGTSELTASMFIAYIAFYFQIITPAKNTANAFTMLQRGLAAGERVLRILDTPAAVKDAPDAGPKNSFDAEIRFNQVYFRYKDVDVLKDISLSVPKGRVVALVGESGSGKSTLADLIPRFYDVTGGSITMDGTDIRKIRMKDLRRLIAIVSQEAILFHDSVLNNIAFGDEQPDRERAIHAARTANAHDFIMQLEQGYDTNIGDRGLRLSGGQRQRLTIARAIYKNAPLLILDEATSALDTESERAVQAAINDLMKNRTCLVIAHRLSTVRHADEIIVLRKGEIIERGTHDQLYQENGMYRRLVDMQEVR